jgi:hypothetical protein
MTKQFVLTDTDLLNIATLATAVEGFNTTVVSLLRGEQVNHVLWSGTVYLDAAGQWSKSFTVPIGAVAWWPALEAGVTVLTTDGPAGVAPTNGPGVFVFPVVNVANPLVGRVFPAVGKQLTVYGTASIPRAGMLAVYSNPQNPA